MRLWFCQISFLIVTLGAVLLRDAASLREISLFA
jgi:hypothetical protein